MKAKVICIGGIPGTGKTTLSYHLAAIFHVDKVINIDTLKATLKSLKVNSDPYLLTTSHEAYKLENIGPITGYYRYSNALNSYVVSLLKSLSNERLVIIEGVTVNDQLIELLNQERIDYLYFLLTTNHRDLKKRYLEKSKLRKSNWLEHLDILWQIEKELKQSHGILIKNNYKNQAIQKMEEIIYENIYL